MSSPGKWKLDRKAMRRKEDVHYQWKNKVSGQVLEVADVHMERKGQFPQLYTLYLDGEDIGEKDNNKERVYSQATSFMRNNPKGGY